MFSCQTFGVQIPFPKITTRVIHISKKKYPPPKFPNPTPFFHRDPHLVANCMKIYDTKNASDPDVKKQHNFRQAIFRALNCYSTFFKFSAIRNHANNF
jgi:hypothetical protein